jgi:hypothetical protein
MKVHWVFRQTNVDLDLNLRQVCEYMRRALTKHIDDAIPIHFDIPDYNQH